MLEWVELVCLVEIFYISHDGQKSGYGQGFFGDLMVDFGVF